jgi:hypothetical protein
MYKPNCPYVYILRTTTFMFGLSRQKDLITITTYVHKHKHTRRYPYIQINKTTCPPCCHSVLSPPPNHKVLVPPMHAHDTRNNLSGLSNAQQLSSCCELRIENRKVIEICTEPGASGLLYQSPDGKVYMRRDGSVHALNAIDIQIWTRQVGWLNDDIWLSALIPINDQNRLRHVTIVILSSVTLAWQSHH